MDRWNVRVLIGAGLVVMGLLMLLERVGLFRGAVGLFWGAAFALAGAYFLYRFLSNMRGEWWAAIPAFALLGIGAESLLGNVLEDWGGFFFLAGLGAGFFAIYFSDRQRWWAIIPGGVLVTLALTTVIDQAGGMETGGVLFLGLGLTFLLVAVLASLQWPWIPGVVLLVIGALIGAPFAGGMNLVWPVALIAGGLLLILQFARKH
ncbi:MAG: hypothetical protein ACM3MF_03380 [Anaerolineae bacterium]